MSIPRSSCYPYSHFSEEKQKRLNKLPTVTQLSPGPALDNPKRPGFGAQFQPRSHRTAAEGAGSRQRADHGGRGEVARGHGAPSRQAPICPRRSSIISKRTDAPASRHIPGGPSDVPFCFRHPASPSPRPHQRPQLSPFLELRAWPGDEEKDGCIRRHHSASSPSQREVTHRPRCSKRLKKQRPQVGRFSGLRILLGCSHGLPSLCTETPPSQIPDPWVKYSMFAYFCLTLASPCAFPSPWSTQRKSPLKGL